MKRAVDLFEESFFDSLWAKPIWCRSCHDFCPLRSLEKHINLERDFELQFVDPHPNRPYDFNNLSNYKFIDRVDRPKLDDLFRYLEKLKNSYIPTENICHYNDTLGEIEIVMETLCKRVLLY